MSRHRHTRAQITCVRTHASEQACRDFLFALSSPAAGGHSKSFSLPAVTFLKQIGPASVTSPSRAFAILTTCMVHACHESTHVCTQVHMHTARSRLSPGPAPPHHHEGRLADPVQAERGCLALRPPRCPLSWWLVGPPVCQGPLCPTRSTTSWHVEGPPYTRVAPACKGPQHNFQV